MAVIQVKCIIMFEIFVLAPWFMVRHKALVFLFLLYISKFFKVFLSECIIYVLGDSLVTLWPIIGYYLIAVWLY